MALLITIMILSLLVLVTVQFHRSSWHNFRVSTNFKIHNQLRTISDSGIHIASTILQSDLETDQLDTPTDVWARVQDEELGTFFEDASLRLTINDLGGRLPINSIVADEADTDEVYLVFRAILKSLLLSDNFDFDTETDAEALLDAITDWIDADDEQSEYGAESDYYQSLDKSYDCENAPLRYTEELLLIKGITPELLYGTEDKPGLIDFITVYDTDGKININTVNPGLLRSFDILITDEMVDNFISFREEEANRFILEDTSWYQSVEGWPADIVLEDKLLSSQSRFFQITSRASHDTFQVTKIVDLERSSDGTLTPLNQQID